MGRYQTAVPLSAGGTAEIYKAFDPSLQRYVALKFLHRDDPVLVERMFREARAQARIQHEGICKVYDMGQLDERPYIAMQYIDGEELGTAGRRMTLEEKVRVVRQVAEALHAAHREGVIHRDIKPANIMVQQQSDGDWKPVLVDFGLVWEHETEGLTHAGQVLGTPPYLAPEQVEGRREGLDRRTDLYGLGATLYDLLTGHPPFSGDQGVELLMKTLRDEPVSPQRLNPRIPSDLDTIVLKCLEKEPQRRYDSARALADDLQRFLDGEPIAARPASVSYRLRKRLNKHKALVAVSALALMVLVVAAAVVLSVRLQAEERRQLEQRFAQVGRDIDSLMRAVHMTPMHDIRYAKDRVRTKIGALERELAEVGSVGAGPAHFALGRGHLALLEDTPAREHLEQAWALGYRTPEVAYSLGLVLGRQYESQLSIAANQSNTQLREARLRGPDTELRAAAIDFLRSASGAESVATEYVEALFALYDRRYEAALERARQALVKQPWLYEAKILIGNTHAQRGNLARNQGDSQGARQAFDQAEKAYREAIASAASQLLAYVGLCDVGESRMQLELRDQGEDMGQAKEQALQACADASRIDPELALPHIHLANTYRFWAKRQVWTGEDPAESLGLARAEAERAVAVRPDNADALEALAGVLLQQGETFVISRSEDPTPVLQAAAATYRRALELRPQDPVLYNVMGAAYSSLATYEYRTGINPEGNLELAAQSLKSAIELAPDIYPPQYNLGNVYYWRGAYEFSSGLDFRASTELALHHHRRAVEIDPDVDWNNLSLGADFGNLATSTFLSGGDPMPLMEQSLNYINRAIELNPEVGEFYNRRIGARLNKGHFRLYQDQDPSNDLQAVRADIVKLSQKNPDTVVPHGRRALAETLAARWAMQRGQDAQPNFRAAEQAIRNMDRYPDDAFPLVVRLEYYPWRVRWELSQERSVGSYLSRGYAAVEQASNLGVLEPDALACRGRLQLLEALLLREDSPERKRLLELSEQDLREALDRNRWLHPEIQPWLAEARLLLGKEPAIDGPRS